MAMKLRGHQALRSEPKDSGLGISPAHAGDVGAAGIEPATARL
jgi:hypothetical protein